MKTILLSQDFCVSGIQEGFMQLFLIQDLFVIGGPMAESGTLEAETCGPCFQPLFLLT